MSGPPYPPAPTAGSNAIGSFAIGVSPIGTIAAFDYWKTVISQYANSPVLTALIGSDDAALDPTEFFDELFDDIWNVDTAQGYGLDVWGRIVGVTRNLQIPNASVAYFGFDEANPSWTGFGPGATQGGFYSGPLSTTTFSLLDADFRTLILAKAGTNISDGGIPAINQLLLNLFPGRGVTYVQDNQDMTLTYVFDFDLSVVELAILGQENALPNPAGVGISITHL